MAKLEIINGPSAGRTIHLPDQGLCIFGREDDVDFPLKFEKISRRHFGIEATAQGYMLTDLASKNGTFVNEKTVAAHALKSGDVLRAGALELKFLQEEETVYSASAQTDQPVTADGDAIVHQCETCGEDISLDMVTGGVAKRIASVILCGNCVRRTEALNLQGVIAVEELRRLLGLPDRPEDSEEKKRSTRRHSRRKRFSDD